MINIKYRLCEQVRRLGAWLACLGAQAAYQSREYPPELLRVGDVIQPILWYKTASYSPTGDRSFSTEDMRVTEIQWPRVTFKFMGSNYFLTGTVVHEDVTRMTLHLVSRL